MEKDGQAIRLGMGHGPFALDRAAPGGNHVVLDARMLCSIFRGAIYPSVSTMACNFRFSEV
jgi:hypothetical protein